MSVDVHFVLTVLKREFLVTTEGLRLLCYGSKDQSVVVSLGFRPEFKVKVRTEGEEKENVNY